MIVYQQLLTHNFLNLPRDLTSWINSMMTLVSSDELAKDVTGAEALLERHQVSHACLSTGFLLACVPVTYKVAINVLFYFCIAICIESYF